MSSILILYAKFLGLAIVPYGLGYAYGYLVRMFEAAASLSDNNNHE